MPAPSLRRRALVYVPPPLARARGRTLDAYVAAGLPLAARELRAGVRPLGLVYGLRRVRSVDASLVDEAARLARRYRTRRAFVLSRAIILGAGLDRPRA